MGIGIDVVDVKHFERLAKKKASYLPRWFTPEEVQECEARKRGKYECYAARFAAKEAFFKAVGRKFPWTEIRVESPNGVPLVRCSGSAFEATKNYRILLSLTHISSLALGVVVLSQDD
ncbi:MAG: holo-ACP synthase [bacterium]